ncbi:hypothetical protein FKM82_011914 [Ascaphus truei]
MWKTFKGFSTTASRFKKQLFSIPHIVSLSILSVTYKFPFSKFTSKYCSLTPETIRNFLIDNSLTSTPRSFAMFPAREPFFISSYIEY